MTFILYAQDKPRSIADIVERHLHAEQVVRSGNTHILMKENASITIQTYTGDSEQNKRFSFLKNDASFNLLRKRIRQTSDLNGTIVEFEEVGEDQARYLAETLGLRLAERNIGYFSGKYDGAFSYWD